MKLAAAVAFASIVLFAAPARASSGYGNSIASRTFRYTYVEHQRKMFRDGDQAQRYMASRDRALKLRFLGFQTKAEQAIASAKKRGTPIGPYDLFLPSVRMKKPGDVAKIKRKAYPLNLVLDVSDEQARASFEITATRPWTAAQLESLSATLKKIAITKPGEDAGDDLDDARRDRAADLLAAAGFEAPIAVTHVDEHFGLYVGTVTEVPAKDRARVTRALQAALVRLLPTVRARLTHADVHTRLAIEGLRPMKPLVDTDPKKLASSFHPWGPLVSGDLIRMREDLGHVSAILMISPKGTYDWGTISKEMTTILRDAGVADPHRELIESEAARLGGDDR